MLALHAREVLLVTDTAWLSADEEAELRAQERGQQAAPNMAYGVTTDCPC